MALYLSEDDVGRHLTMEACIEAVEEAFRQWAAGAATNRPRARAAMRGGLLHVLAAASDQLGRMAAKVYATTRAGARFVVLLFDGASAELLAVIEADRLGRTRTGAASGVATRHLARRDARTLGILGTGWQARGQARAIAAVRRLDGIRAYGRDRERLLRFCREAGEECGVPATPAASAEEAVRGADIVVTATNAAEPVLKGSWLSPGAHLNAVGSNRAERREIDAEAVERADLIVVDSLEQARLEAGDLLAPDVTPAALERAVELAAVVAGRHPGREGEGRITLFKSLGIGLEDLAAASLVYDRARAAGAGRAI
jgi:ornithine cyclodeaminase/alanine dehydrogenase-like protein (mu-crystallin family)